MVGRLISLHQIGSVLFLSFIFNWIPSPRHCFQETQPFSKKRSKKQKWLDNETSVSLCRLVDSTTLQKKESRFRPQKEPCHYKKWQSKRYKPFLLQMQSKCIWGLAVNNGPKNAAKFVASIGLSITENIEKVACLEKNINSYIYCSSSSTWINVNCNCCNYILFIKLS